MRGREKQREGEIGSMPRRQWRKGSGAWMLHSQGRLAPVDHAAVPQGRGRPTAVAGWHHTGLNPGPHATRRCSSW